MTSFFYVVSIAFHTSVPALQKCMDTSRKKVFWLRVQPLVHRLLYLFVGPERLASHRLFEWSKDVKITWGEVWRVRPMWKTLGGHILDCCNSWMGSMGLSIVMLQQNTCTQKSMSFGLDGRTQVILEEICICFTGHSLTPGHVVLQNYHSFIPKENQHNLSHRWLCAEFSQFWWGGTAPFLARILGFQLVVVDPDFISSNSSY